MRLTIAAAALNRWLVAGEGVVAWLLLAAIIVITFTQVVCRYVLGLPLAWSQELATYLFVGLCYVGAVIAVPTAGHYGIDLLVRHLPAPLQALCRGIAFSVCFAFAIMLIVTGLPFVVDSVDRSASLSIRMATFYAAIPLCGALIALHLALGSLSGPVTLAATHDDPGAGGREVR